MKRTNIYLDDAQVAMLSAVSRADGVSRAEVVRRLIERGVSGEELRDLDADLAAIDGSFGILRDAEIPARGPDARSRHLDRIARS